MEYTDNFFYDIIKNADFVDATKRQYLNNLDRLQTLIYIEPNNSIQYIVFHPDEFIPNVKKYAKKQSGRFTSKTSPMFTEAFVKPIIGFFLHNVEFREEHLDLYEQWGKIKHILHKPSVKKEDSNEPSEREINAYMPLSEIINIRDQLPKGSMKRLVLYLYTEIPPLRDDYGQIHIYKSASERRKILEITKDEDITYPENNLIPSNEEVRSGIIPQNSVTENYLLLKEHLIVVQHYKTSKKYGANRIPIPEVVMDEITESLNNIPREYLLIKENKQPLVAYNTGSEWINTIFKNTLNNRYITIDAMRHIWITDRKVNNLPLEEQQRIARIMAHSMTTQLRYAWNISTD